MNRRHVIKTLGALFPAGLAGSAWAQTSRPMRIVVPYAAGGQTDVLARALATSMEKTLGRTVLTENRPGAAAAIGTKYVQTAAPDGDTILYHNSGFVGVALLQKAPIYDPIKDFAPIAMTGSGPNFLMVHESVPAKTLPEFIAWAKEQPRGVECANAGLNSGGHISALMFAKLAGVELLHIPYKGSAEVTTALVGGEVKMQISVTTESLNPYIKSGRVRLLGVATAKRTSLAPDVPAIGEVVPGYAIDGWFGLLAPAGTPLERREQIARAVKVALEDPRVQSRYREVFQEAIYRGPKEFTEAITASVVFYKRIISELNLTQQ